MISLHNVGWGTGGCTTQSREVVIVEHLTMLIESDSNGLCGG